MFEKFHYLLFIYYYFSNLPFKHPLLYYIKPLTFINSSSHPVYYDLDLAASLSAHALTAYAGR